MWEATESETVGGFVKEEEEEATFDVDEITEAAIATLTCTSFCQTYGVHYNYTFILQTEHHTI